LEKIPVPRTYQWLFDDNYRAANKVKAFPDNQFLELFRSCLETQSLANIQRLTTYVIDKMGGFEIDGWVFHRPLDLK